MVERAEELKREIDVTRDNLSVTLDAIGDRVSPGRIAERRVNRVRQTTGRLRERVMGSDDSSDGGTGSVPGRAQSVGETVSGTAGAGNPLLAGALAFGFGALLASLLPSTDAEQSVARSIAEPLKSQATEMGKEVASTAKETAQDAMETTKQAVADAKDEVSSEAAGAAQQVKGQASSAKERVTDTAAGSSGTGTGPVGPGTGFIV